MKSLPRFLLATLALFPLMMYGQNVAINNTGAAPNSSALLDIQSNSKGVLIPRMTTADRNAIASPATGLLVFDTNTGSFWFRSSGGWRELIDQSNSPWIEDASLNVRTRNGGNVSITPGSPTGFGKLNVVAQTPETNTTESVIQVIRSTSGTAAAGLSGSIDFYNEVSNGGFPATARIVCESLNTTPGNHASSMEFFTAGSGVLDSKLYLGPANIGINTSTPSIFSILDVNGTINTNSKITRNSITGTSNLVPLCYGVVDQIGNILGGTANFTVLKTSTGIYYIESASITAGCTIIATPRASSVGNIGARSATSAVETGSIYVTIFNSAGTLVDYGFDFIIYKP
jgi:hypothetical protein